MKLSLHILFSTLTVVSVVSSILPAYGLLKDNSLSNKNALNLLTNHSQFIQTNTSKTFSNLTTPSNILADNHTKSGVLLLLSNTSSEYLAYEGNKNVILDASKIYHTNGKITSYSWKQIGGPPVNLNSTVTPSVKFNATCETANSVITFRVTTTDNTNKSSSSLAHIKIADGPVATICREAVFTPSTLPLAFKNGTSYPFKLNLETKFNSISKIVAISEYEPTDPFGNGDRYFINNFGGQTTSNGAPQQTISLVNNTNPLITNQFLDGNFTSKYIAIQGKFTLASLKFCIEGIPLVKTNATKNLNASALASNPRDIREQCNIPNSQSSTKNITESSKAISKAVPTNNSTNSSNANRYQYGMQQRNPAVSPQYTYPPSYQAPQNPYPYSPPQYTYPPSYQAPQNPYQNRPPIANAGTNQVVNPGTFVVLNGAGSYDPNGGFITSYLWQQTAGGRAIQLAGANTPTPTFVAPSITSGTTLTFRLTVINNVGASSSSSVSIFVTRNNPGQVPIAIATTTSQVASRGSVVALDGTRSFSQSGVPIVSYSWVQTAGVSVALNGANTARATFTAPQIPFANLKFSLTVTDSRGLVSNPASSPQSTVTITVR